MASPTKLTILALVAVLSVADAATARPSAQSAEGWPTQRQPRRRLEGWPARCANPFGVMLPSQVVRAPGGIEVAKTLGAVYFRPSAVFLDEWQGSCPECDIGQNAGLRLVLTVRANGRGQATSPPTDLVTYGKTLGQVLETYRPALLVVENEENSRLFYTGSPEDYAAELRAACEVAHAKGIPCTNGGLVSTLVALLVYDHYLEKGQTQLA
ncbi:MAG: hypothetical protein ACP5NF_08005 [Thermoanaerobaculum sp.]